MTCPRMERWILQECGGETWRLQRRMLDRHCARCPSCAQYRKAISGWLQTAREALDVGGLGTEAVGRTVERIAQEPGQRVGRWDAFERWREGPVALRPVIGFACALLFLFFAWGVASRRESPAVSAPAAPSLLLADLSATDLWELELDVFFESLGAAGRDLVRVFPEESEFYGDDIDEIAREILSLEEVAG